MSPQQMVAWGSNPSLTVTPYQLLMSTKQTAQSGTDNIQVLTGQPPVLAQLPVMEYQPVITASASDVNTYSYAYNVPDSVNVDGGNQPMRS